MPTAFRITAFGGIAPRVSPRLLQDNMAQIANNLDMSSGEIKPIGSTTFISKPNKTMPPLTMFLARNGLSSSAWFIWPNDVDVVRAPLSSDVESRYYWTGDGEPRYATFTKATQSGNNDYPSHYWTLGVPAPLTKPTVSPSGGVGAAVTRLYCYTFFSELGEESAPSPASDLITGKIDGEWAISGMDAVPANTGGISNITYSGKEVTITADGNHFNRVGEKITVAGVTTVTNVNGTWALTAVNTTAKTMTFTVTNTPTGTYNNATDTGDTWARAANWNTTNMKRRLYRSAGTNATFQLVNDNVGTTYSDTLTDAQIMGDELISQTWYPPPVGLKGLISHPSGAVGGFVNNMFCWSEPYQPHAWPPEYQSAADFDIVGAAVYGSETVVGTRGNPYVISGSEPAVMSMDRISAAYPCLSKNGMVGVGDGVLYPAAHGMVYIGQGGMRNFTDNHYDENGWAALNPSTMSAEFVKGKVFIRYTDNYDNDSLLIFYQGELKTASRSCSSLYTDPATGNLYLGDSNGIHQLDANTANPLTASWKSKEFVLSAPVNLGAAKIEYELIMSDADIAAMAAAYAAAVAANEVIMAGGNVGGEINDLTINSGTINASYAFLPVPDQAPNNELTFTLYKGNTIIFSRVINSTQAFRLPGGLKYDRFSVEVSTQNSVRAILIGETMQSLKAA